MPAILPPHILTADQLGALSGLAVLAQSAPHTAAGVCGLGYNAAYSATGWGYHLARLAATGWASSFSAATALPRHLLGASAAHLDTITADPRALRAACRALLDAVQLVDDSADPIDEMLTALDAAGDDLDALAALGAL